MTQATLFGREGVGQTRDALDRFFTPLPLARVICQALRDRLKLEPRLVLEPSVGGGNFVRAARETWPGCYVFGVDIDPDAEGFKLCNEHHVGDWLEFGPKMTPASFDLSIGNPPFTGATAIEHIEATQTPADIVAAILPWAPLGGVGRWSHLMSGKPLFRCTHIEDPVTPADQGLFCSLLRFASGEDAAR